MGFGMQEIQLACIEINSFASVQRTGVQKALIGGILKMFFHGSPLDLAKPLFSPFQNREFNARRRQAPSAGFHNRNLLNSYCPAICLNRLSLFARRLVQEGPGARQQEGGRRKTRASPKKKKRRRRGEEEKKKRRRRGEEKEQKRRRRGEEDRTQTHARTRPHKRSDKNPTARYGKQNRPKKTRSAKKTSFPGGGGGGQKKTT